MEKIQELKAKAYDLIAQLEQAQAYIKGISEQLAEVNKEIASEQEKLKPTEENG